MNYHCPSCARKPLVRAKCRLEAEIKAKRDAEQRAKAKLERDRLERGQADELAGAMNEFFTALYTEDTDAYPNPDMSNYLTPFADLPLSSPDSITVTTEFGVLEETGNVTIISAGGTTHPYDEADDEEYDEELSYHHVHSPHDGPENYVVMTEDTAALPAAGSSDWVTAVALQHQQQQNTWLLPQQMQNMYNVAMGTNTTPPPTQHTAPVIHHQEGDIGQNPDSTDDEHDGDEADVDTDDVLEADDDDDDDDTAGVIADGALTPTLGAANVALP